MKIKCPVCGIQGFLEVRKRSPRIKHYMGIKNNKRIYQIHVIDYSQIRNLIPSDSLINIGIKGFKSDSISENNWGRRLAWSRL